MAHEHKLNNWMKAHPVLMDALWVVPTFFLFGLTSIIGAQANANGRLPTIWVLTPIVVLEWLPMIWRRERTAVVGFIVAAANFAHVLLNIPILPSNFSALLMVYALAAYCNRRISRIALGAGLFGAILSALSEKTSLLGDRTEVSKEAIIFAAVFQSVLILLAWVLGDLSKARKSAVFELQEKARRLEIEREQERVIAAADERSRIAREMHDIIAHSLSVIIAQADGARYLADKDPQAASKTLETIAKTGRGSLTEMRRLIGVLRSETDATWQPAPSLAELPNLVETVKLSGLDIDFTSEGTQKQELPSGAELAAYRVFQEAFTNILKHAGPQAKVKASQNWEKNGLRLVIEDNGRGNANDASAQGSQKGIVGMKERVQLYDGWVKADHKIGGGFKVEAFIPYTFD